MHLVVGHGLHTVAVSAVRVGPIGLALVLGWAWWAARRERVAVMAAALWAPLGVICAVVIGQSLEELPTVHWTAFHGLMVHSSEVAGPSDHAAMAAATTAGLFLAGRRFGLVAGGAWLLMALALLGSGVPVDDVAGGTVVGVTVTLIGFVLFEGPLRRTVARLRRTRLRSFTGRGKTS
jgi:membrane-associated phospholipid phosphatase